MAFINVVLRIKFDARFMFRLNYLKFVYFIQIYKISNMDLDN